MQSKKGEEIGINIGHQGAFDMLAIKDKWTFYFTTDKDSESKLYLGSNLITTLIDDIPIEGSDHAISSGGVKSCIETLNSTIEREVAELNSTIEREVAELNSIIEREVETLETSMNSKFDEQSSSISGITTYDKIIRTQSEFEELIASSTWLDAKSVAFIGDGGDLVFDAGLGSSTSSKLTIPTNVITIQGFNKATIEGMYWIGYESDTIRDAYDNRCIRDLQSNGSGMGFAYCRNLYNCYGTGGNIGMYLCDNLINCSSSNTNDGFSICTYLSNCKSDNSSSNGFSGCDNLSNCKSDISSNGFSDCDNLSNCQSDNSSSNGFSDCDNLSNCKSNSSSNGFSDCDNLTNCKSDISSGYDFDSCNGLINCISSTSSSSRGINSCYKVLYCRSYSYISSYSSFTSSSTYTCANTLNGGWNFTESIMIS